MIQQSHFWVYTLKNWKQDLKEIFAQPCPLFTIVKKRKQGFPGGAVVENLPANAGDTGSSPGLGRSHMLQSD